MGTFLKVIGIIVVVFGILVVVFSLFGAGRFLNFMTSPGTTEESAPMMPWTGMALAGGIGGALGGLGILIGGVALYCLGTIYNDIKDIKARYQ